MATTDHPHVGTLREAPLHASLKAWCCRPGDRTEVAVDGFVVDVVRPDTVRGDLLIEVQTKGFSSMKRKLVSLLDSGHRLRVVHPIPIEKMIVKVDEHGAIDRRRSPKRGAPPDVFGELVSFPTLIDHAGFELELVMVREEEFRRHDPTRAWRRRGWVIDHRRLVEIVDTLPLASSGDLLGLLPGGLPDPFTTADLASALGRPRRLAQQAAYCLRHTGVITEVGKRANAVEYAVS